MAEISKPYHNLFHTFSVRPHVKFETQSPDETVVLIIRKHPFTQIYWVFNSILILLIGLLVCFFILPQFFDPQHIFIFELFLVFFTFSYIWLNFLLWFFTVGIITNQRILDLDFFNVLYKEFTATTIEHVSDLTTKVGGFFRSFLNFGAVFVKTQGFEQNIEFIDVPRPAEIVEIINNLMNEDSP